MDSNMGLDSSKSNGENSALPKSTYKALHKDSQCFPAPFTIIQERRRCEQPGNPRMDVSACAFPPNDDTVLITLTTFSSAHRNFRAGYVQSWDLLDDVNTEVDGSNDSLFTYAPRPALSFSPQGDLISVILNSGRGQLILVEKYMDNSLEPCKVDCRAGQGLTDTSLCSRALCCVFSTDGTNVVTVTNATLQMYRTSRETHELCLWKVCSERTLQCVWRVSCEVILPNFLGCLVSCVFSPDSSLLSLSTSVGQLYVLKTRTLELFAAIKTETLAFDSKCICYFNPGVAHGRLGAICCVVGRFQVWKLAAGEATCIDETQVTMDSLKLTTFSYSLDGSRLAFGTSGGKVLVYESEPLQALFELDPYQHSAVESNITEVPVHSVAFAKSCQELAVGYGNNHVRLWQLPIAMDLKHMCRLTIIKIVPPCKLRHLPLPKSVIAYLLYTYITVDDDDAIVE